MYRDANVPTLRLRGQGSIGCVGGFVVHVSVWQESEYQQESVLRISDHWSSRLWNRNNLFGSKEWEKHESKTGGEKSRRRGAAKGPIDEMKYHVTFNQEFTSWAIVVRL